MFAVRFVLIAQSKQPHIIENLLLNYCTFEKVTKTFCLIVLVKDLSHYFHFQNNPKRQENRANMDVILLILAMPLEYWAVLN